MLGCFLFIQIWIAELRRGSDLPCLAGFDFPNFGSHVGFRIYCFRMRSNTVLVRTHMCSSTLLCQRVLSTVSGLVGDQVCQILSSESRWGTSLVIGRWSRFHARFFGFNSCIFMREVL